MQMFARFSALLGVMVVAGCASINPFATKPDPKTQPAVLEQFPSTLSVKTRWSTSVGKAGSYEFIPGVIGNDIYAAAADGKITRIDGSIGKNVWQINTGIEITAGVGAGDNVVVVAGKKGVILAYDQNGKFLWKEQASSEILTAPVVGQGLVVIRSNDNKIAAYDAISGIRKWAVDRAMPPLTLRNISGLIITDKAVMAGLPGGRLVAFALNNGGVRWDSVVGEPKGATELERIADVAGRPVVMGDDICAVAYQGRVACFDAATGSLRWEKKTSSEVGVDVDELYVFVADDSGTLSAYARNSGSSAWRTEKLANRRLTAPISFGRAVAVGDFEGKVHFLSRTDGAFIARVNTDGSQILSTPIVSGSNLIFQTKSGTVVALTTE